MKTTRRTFLGGVASTSLPLGAGVSVAVAAGVTPAVPENPDLLAAHARLLVAQRELREAKDALDWIADEWRHLWPLAPEPLLWGANADRGSRTETAERDIVDRFIYRETAELTERFTLKQRQQLPRTCFNIMTSDDARETIARWENSLPRGKTAKSIERHRSNREEALTIYRRRLALAEEYEAKKKMLRDKAGVDPARKRIALAQDTLDFVCCEISNLPAKGMAGLSIKADAINANDYVEVFKKGGTVLGEMARFVQQFIDLNGRTSA